MLVISMGFLVSYFVFSWKLGIILSLVIGTIGIISSYLSEKIAWLWMGLGRISGYVVSNFLLGLVFLGILFPISIFWKLFHKDQLMLSRDRKSFFVDINREMDKRDFEKMW
jgi:hypothetical protein